MSTQILIVYDTNGGHTHDMARKVANGVDSIAGSEALLRQVAKVTTNISEHAEAVPDSGAPFVSKDDIDSCSGLILGSPTHFGNMSASMKYFIDQTTSHWLGGTLSGKPAGVFTSTGSQHGGQEATLLTMMLPLMHHGMVICGLPYTHPGLMQTETGGTPYGPSHVAGERNDKPISTIESELCMLLGQRVATFAQRLSQ